MASKATITDDLASWQARYPDPHASAEDNAAARDAEHKWLAPFSGKTVLTREEVQELVEWKFASMPHRLARAIQCIEEPRWEGSSEDVGAEELIRLALAAEDDLVALSLLSVTGGGVYGFGPAMGSVVLAACRPERFTVADSRAIKSLRALQLMPMGPESFRLADWERYLSVCRGLADGAGKSLRYVDQALWVAADDPSLGDPYAGKAGEVWAYVGNVRRGEDGKRTSGAILHRPTCARCQGGKGSHGGAGPRAQWKRFMSMREARAWTKGQGLSNVRTCEQCKPW